jgi:hypothetical protein
MRLVAVAFLTACAPSYENELARIDKRLAAMETRIAAVDDHAIAASSAASTAASSASLAAQNAGAAVKACDDKPPTPLASPQWSCAAHCLDTYSCNSNGKNNVTYAPITSTGATAAEAFSALEKKCKDEVYVNGHCIDGKFTRTSATIVNACTRN